MSDIVNNKIEDYIRKNSSKEPEILKDLNKETYLKVLNPRMLSGHIQGRFLSIITKLIKPKKILEIGTYTGYSAICMAEGLIENGIIHTIDINEELVSIQNKYFAKSKCNNSIIQHVGDARNIIKSINEKFDLVFLDADKENYIEYYELVIEKVKKGGLIIADNVLWTGKVVEPEKDDDELTQYLIDFNKMINEDDRVENIILPLRDGLNVILKN
jgi:predicted O-methyltransferase YrrM|tara:strand:- start:347 stop:991 length:645 start_codon:yes stop_codon:yes gene_type:complete